MILKTISVIHLHCTSHIAQYFLRTGTGLDDVAPLGLSALFSVASEFSGEAETDKTIMSGIFGFGPADDFGVLSCRDDNVRFFLLFEGAGTDQLPTFRDQFLRGACLALFKAFYERLPLNCRGIHHSEDETLSKIVTSAIPSYDFVGVSHFVPTHSLRFPIKDGSAFSHEVQEFDYLGSGFRHSDIAQAINRTITGLIAKSSDIYAYYEGLRDQLAEFMQVPPYSLVLAFGSATLTNPDPALYPHYVCLIDAYPLSLHFTFGIPVKSSDAEMLDGTVSLRERRRRF